MKLNIPSKKAKKVTAISSGTVNPIHVIPALGKDEGEVINLSHLQGWDDLTVQKQRYLVSFSKNNLKKKRAALAVGLDTYDVTTWLKDDAVFHQMYHDIIDLHVEGVEEVDYLSAYSNSSSRGRFLNNRSKHYKDQEEKSSAPRIGTQNNTNIFAMLNSKEATSKGLAGVQEVFNKLKENGELPEAKQVEQD